MGDVYTNPPQSRNEAILRATIDGTEYTAPPQSRIEDLLLELKEAIEQGGGAGGMSKDTYDPDNAVATAGGIAAYVDDEITDLHLGTASTKNSTSVVTESSDLVESGAVKELVGWGNNNLFNKNDLLEMTYINLTNGALVQESIAGWDTTKPIPIKVGLPVIFSGNSDMGNNRVRYRICDSNDTPLVYGGFPANSATGKVTPTQGAYIQFTMRYDTIDTFKVNYASVEETKADNSVIAPTENGTTASQAYAVGSHAIRNGAFITWKNAKAQGETINDASDYTSGDVGSELFSNNGNVYTGSYDDYTTDGIYFVSASLTNLPEPNVDNCVLIVKGKSDGSIIMQTVFKATTSSGSAMYIRRYANNAWSAWYKYEGTIIS